MTLSRPRTLLLTAIAAVVILVAGAATAISAPSLPEIGADELLASMAEAQPPESVSGELTATLGLGLPVLPEDAEGGLTDLLGTMRLRLERSPDGLRVALLRQSSERVLVTDGATLSTWDSRTFTATQMTLPDLAGMKGDAASRSDKADALQDLDPTAIAQRVLDMVGAYGEVTVDGTGRVAGRATYRLALAPTDATTTIGRIEVDVDDETRMPLRLAIFAGNAAAPSMELEWTRVSFAPIDPELFAFTPPPGATVTEPDHDRQTNAPTEPSPPPAAQLFTLLDVLPERPLVGSGFSTVAVLPLPPARPIAPDAESTPSPDGAPGADAFAALLPLDGPLLSARLVDIDGRSFALVGFVPLSHLDTVAADLAGAPAP